MSCTDITPPACSCTSRARNEHPGPHALLDVHGEHPGVFLENEEQREAITHVVRLVPLVGREGEPASRA